MRMLSKAYPLTSSREIAAACAFSRASKESNLSLKEIGTGSNGSKMNYLRFSARMGQLLSSTPNVGFERT